MHDEHATYLLASAARQLEAERTTCRAALRDAPEAERDFAAARQALTSMLSLMCQLADAHDLPRDDDVSLDDIDPERGRCWAWRPPPPPRGNLPSRPERSLRCRPMTVAELELDLEVFTGPFDLLLTLVLREEVDLLEVELADVVVSYLDHLEARGELDLEVATEFLVLIAALLELKSRLMLPREEDDLLDLEPGEAAEELLARMLEARRYRRAAEHLAARLAGEDGAPLPRGAAAAALRRVD